jgi:quinol monooxygenase YgiN
MNEIFVFARVIAKPGAIGQLRDAAASIVEPSRHENGNLYYQLFQSVEDDHELWFHARWRDAEALDGHNRSSHVADWVRVVDEYATAPVEVTVTRPVA